MARIRILRVSKPHFFSLVLLPLLLCNPGARALMLLDHLHHCHNLGIANMVWSHYKALLFLVIFNKFYYEESPCIMVLGRWCLEHCALSFIMLMELLLCSPKVMGSIPSKFCNNLMQFLHFYFLSCIFIMFPMFLLSSLCFYCHSCIFTIFLVFLLPLLHLYRLYGVLISCKYYK